MRKGLSLLLVGAMAASLVGCSGGSSEEAKDKKVTLNVVTTYAGEDTNAQNYQDAIAAWQKETGNVIKDNSATSDENFKAKVALDFQAGSEPDVLFYFNGVDSNSFVEQGKVVSIDEIRKSYPDYASNMKDDMLGASPVDGVNYSVPVNGYWEGLFVNEEVCKAAGVEVPNASTTWDQFLEMCETIKNAGYTPIAVSLQEVPHYWFEFTIYNQLDPATHNTVPTAADDTYGKAWAAGLDDIKVLYEKGYLPENTLTAKDAETVEMFTSDKAAFLIDGSWKVGGIEAAVTDIDNFTVTHVPGKGNRKTTDTIGGLSMGYYITAKAWEDESKRDALVDFVSYMTSDEMVSKFSGTAATALKNGTKLDESTLSALGVDAVKFCSELTGIAPAVQDNLSQDVRTPIFSEMAQIVKGEKTSSDAVQQVLDLIAENQ